MKYPFVRREAIQFSTVHYLPDLNGGWELRLPRFLLQEERGDWWSSWEESRVASMRAHLRPGDILWDIGAELGWQSVILAKIVGPENVVLVEPSDSFWPIIRMVWEANLDAPPMACVQALVGADPTVPIAPSVTVRTWPACCSVPEVLTDVWAYRYLHTPKDVASIPVTTLDDIVVMLGCPRAISIDVEGAEGLVLQGGTRMLADCRPLLWVSEHPDLQLNNYPESLVVEHLLGAMNYKRTWLGDDHEVQVLYQSAETHPWVR